MQQIILRLSSKPKKACIKPPFDTNNFTQRLTRAYHHPATESLYRLCDEKISCTLTLAWVPYQFGFAPFPICLQCKISGSSVSSIFSHEVSYQIKKSDRSQFLKISSDGLGLESLKVSKVRFFRILAKILSI